MSAGRARRLGIPAGLALSLMAASLGAQAPEAARPRLALSAGGDVRGASGMSTLWLGNASVEWPTGVRGVGVRTELTYGWRAPHDQRLGPDPALVDCNGPCPASTLETRTRVFGATVSGTYELPIASRIRPYLFTGVGLFRTRSHLRYDRPTLPGCPIEMLCATAQTVATAPVTFVDASGGATMHTGAGLAISLGRSELLLEGRYLLLSGTGTRALSGAIPITIGIRF